MKLFDIRKASLAIIGLAVFGVVMADGAVNYKVTSTDVDGHTVTINPPGKVSLVVYIIGDAEDEARALSEAVRPLRGKSDFSFVRVVDLRGNVPPAARAMVKRTIRSELDFEAKNLRPIYRTNGNSANPRTDSPMIADFSGTTLLELGWKAPSQHIRCIIFNNEGNEVHNLNHPAPSEVVDILHGMIK